MALVEAHRKGQKERTQAFDEIGWETYDNKAYVYNWLTMPNEYAYPLFNLRHSMQSKISDIFFGYGAHDFYCNYCSRHVNRR